MIDCHPTPKMYYEYLCEIYPHHNLSSDVRDSVLSSTTKLIKEGCHLGPEVPLHYKGRL